MKSCHDGNERAACMFKVMHAQEVNDNGDDYDDDKHTVGMTKANMQSTKIISTDGQ